ncbi:MAG: hypothetical protein LBN30_01070 [Oscillospiraceae bacterium]|nr:hypothetical protein [Oscillospiraceae bacterium]
MKVRTLKRALSLLLALLLAITPIFLIGAAEPGDEEALTGYTVTIPELVGGTVTAKYGTANLAVVSGTTEIPFGDTVTLAVTPKVGYKVSPNTVALNGGAVTLNDEVAEIGGLALVYTFAMPAEHVTVAADFEALKSTVTVTAAKNDEPAAASVSDVSIGDIVTVTWTVTANNFSGYGFEAPFANLSKAYVILKDETIAANSHIPGFYLDYEAADVRVAAEGGVTAIFTPGVPVDIVLKYKAVSYVNTFTPTFPSGGGRTNMAILLNSSVRLTDLGTLNAQGVIYYDNNYVSRVQNSNAIFLPTSSAKPSITQTTTGGNGGIGRTLALQVNDGAVGTPAASVKETVNVGDTVTLIDTITLTKGNAYGFSAVYRLANASKFLLDTAKLASENPGLTLTSETLPSGSVIFVRITALPKDGTVIAAAGTPLILRVPFDVTGMSAAVTVESSPLSAAAATAASTFWLITDPSFDEADLAWFKSGTTFYPLQSMTSSNGSNTERPAAVLKTIIAATDVIAEIAVRSGAATVLAADPENSSPAKTVAATLEFNSAQDAYGYAAALAYNNILSPNLTAMRADNPGVTFEAPNFQLQIVRENNGTVAIPADGSVTLKLTFDVLQTGNVSLSNSTYFNPFLITDAAVKALGDDGVLSGANTTWQTNVNTQEAARTIAVSDKFATLSLSTGYLATGELGEPTRVGIMGVVNEADLEPAEVPLIISVQPGTDVYGFAGAIKHAGGRTALDVAATLEANPALKDRLVFVANGTATSTSDTGTTPRIYIENNGTKLDLTDNKLTINLVFKPTKLALANSGKLTLDTGTTVTSFVLITKPDVYVMKTGNAKAPLNFLAANYAAAEKVGDIAVIQMTSGYVPLRQKYDAGTYNVNGYYVISTAEQLNEFAKAVNGGETTLKGQINANIALDDSFVGIGTAEYPFRGSLYSSTSETVVNATLHYILTLNRTVSVADGSAVGGVINYLGAGGLVYSVEVGGALTVSGNPSSVGGIVGVSNGGTIKNAMNTAAITVSGSAADVGGVVGTVSGGTVSGSGNGRAIPTVASPYVFLSPRGGGGAISGSGNVGGVVGSATDAVLDNDYNAGAVSGSGNVGGIAGLVNGASIVKDSWNGENAPISGASANVGGIVGRIAADSESSEFSNNINLSTITVSGLSSSKGGIVGLASSTPAIYNANYYKTGTATTDALTARECGEFTVSTESTIGAAGKYSPVEDAIGPEPPTGTQTIIVEVTGHGAVTMTYGASAVVLNSGDVVSKNTLVTLTVEAEDGYRLRDDKIALHAYGHRYNTNQYYTLTVADNIVAYTTPASDNEYTLTFSAIFEPIPSSAPSVGNGTEASPYELSSADDFLWFANEVNNGNNSIHAKLVVDIDLTTDTKYDTFTGIGTQYYAGYSGAFDGNGKTITANIKGTSTSGRTALFSWVNGGSVKNLTLKGSVESSNSSERAGIIGYLLNGTVQDCVNYAAIIDGGAGIVGVSTDSSIIRCINYGDVYTESGGASGIVGHLNNIYSHTDDCSIIDCINYGDMTAWKTAAGIVGSITSNSFNDYRFTVSGCKNYGTITSLAPPAMDGMLGDYDTETSKRSAAGIIGYIGVATVYIEDCVNEGDIVGNGNNVAGILGSLTYSYPYGSGNVSITGSSNSGAITSTYNGNDTVSNTYTIRPRTGYAPDLISVGGIAGNLYGAYNSDDYIAWSKLRADNVTLTGNTNSGVIEVGTAKNVGAIAGQLTPESERPEGGVTKFDQNFTTVLVENDSNPTAGTYYDPATQHVENGAVVDNHVTVPPESPTEPEDGDTNAQPSTPSYPSYPSSGNSAATVSESNDDDKQTQNAPAEVAPNVASEIPTTDVPDEFVPLAPAPDAPPAPLAPAADTRTEETTTVQEAPIQSSPTAPNAPRIPTSTSAIIPPVLVAEAEEDTTVVTPPDAASDADNAPEETAAPVAPPANVALPDLIDTISPEVVRETVKNNTTVILIVTITAVAVLAAGGIALAKKRKKAI